MMFFLGRLLFARPSWLRFASFTLYKSIGLAGGDRESEKFDMADIVLALFDFGFAVFELFLLVISSFANQFELLLVASFLIMALMFIFFGLAIFGFLGAGSMRSGC